MLQFFSNYKWFFVVMFVLSAIIIYTFYTVLKPTKKLPIYQPADVNVELVDTTVQYVRKYHKIKDFELINQNGEIVTQQVFANKIYVADFFFTTCQTICPIMTDHMANLQEELLNNDNVLLLSHTVQPEVDSVPQLKKYAKKKGVINSKWHLVTGKKKDIYDLARKSYLASKTDGNGGPYDMIHTENFVLVDQQRRIRGFYDGTKPESITEILEDIKILEREVE
jgi:protein SCO1/2